MIRKWWGRPVSDWTAGYVLDIPYTTSFFRELAPSYLGFVATLQGVRPPSIAAGATYCELACGNGLSTILLAAANPQMNFWGFDFNPEQIVYARRLAAEGGLSNVKFGDQSFEQLVETADPDWPMFDYVVLHGIYSWISPENRSYIVRFLERFVKPGGLVYVSYNCMPGWSSAGPLQRFIREHARRHPDRSDRQVDAALDVLKQLAAGGAGYFVQNPLAQKRIESLGDQNKSYLAHEYLNGHWHPMFHTDVAAELSEARLVYVGSATIAENIDSVGVPAGVLPLINASRDPGWRETLKDFSVNRIFRRDVFLRGASRLKSVEQSRLLAETRLALTVPRNEVVLKFATPLGEANGVPEAYEPIVAALAERPHTIAELAKLPGMKAQTAAGVLQSVALLVHSGQAHPCPYDARGKHVGPAQALNRAISERIAIGDTLPYLAAPAVGSGIAASYAEQFALTQRAAKRPLDDKTPETAWKLMEATGQRLRKDKVVLTSREDNLAELEAQFKAFVETKEPAWKALGVL